MKLVCLCIIVSLGLCAQTNEIQTSCAAVQMNCGYNSRYDLIDTIYRATHKALFDKASNPYTRTMKDSDSVEFKMEPPRFYIGTLEQNQKLARNILANQNLFVNGKISITNAKKWRFVD